MKRSWLDILLGSRYTYSNLQEKNNILKKQFLISQILAIFQTIFIILLAYVSLSTFYPIEHQLKINYDDLSEEQIVHVNHIMANIKHEYLATQKSITFTNNLSKFYKPIYMSSEKALRESETLAGYNTNKNIFIVYSEEDRQLIPTICHELLHSFMHGSEQAHKVIYDLDNYYTCYSSKSVDITIK